MNIFIAVLKRADQEFIINGDHTVSDSDEYNAAGTIFDYHRLDKNNSDGVTEWITSIGPTTEPVYLMVYHFLDFTKYWYITVFLF